MKTKVPKQNNVAVKYGEQERKERDWILFHKRKAVLEHRKMWKWIAHAIAVDKENMYDDIWNYKRDYIMTMILLNEDLKKEAETEEERKHYDERITYYRQAKVNCDCFCCLFYFRYYNHAPQFEIINNRVTQECGNFCPVIWKHKLLNGTEVKNAYCGVSYYGVIANKAYHSEWKKCCKLAYKIAMLPERNIEAYV